MIIQKKSKHYYSLVDKFTGNVAHSGTAYKVTQEQLKTTWYFLGIPVYSVTKILSSKE